MQCLFAKFLGAPEETELINLDNNKINSQHCFRTTASINECLFAGGGRGKLGEIRRVSVSDTRHNFHSLNKRKPAKNLRGELLKQLS